MIELPVFGIPMSVVFRGCAIRLCATGIPTIIASSRYVSLASGRDAERFLGAARLSDQTFHRKPTTAATRYRRTIPDKTSYHTCLHAYNLNTVYRLGYRDTVSRTHPHRKIPPPKHDRERRFQSRAGRSSPNTRAAQSSS